LKTSGQGYGSLSLLDLVQAGNPLAIARAITEIENQSLVGFELGLATQDRGTQCRTLAVTGAPGAGKSSLINALISELLPQYPRIGVLTVDPSSPISGGAVLGDRVRMAAHTSNPDVFIRSLAARGHLGGVTRTTRAVVNLLAAGGMDLVIVETVGTGQSEVEVAEITDVKIVVCAPGMGDEMQAMKAGILEIADLLVVNKGDLPDADRTMAFLEGMLMHRGHDESRLALKVSAVTRDGLTELLEAIGDRINQTPSRTAGYARKGSPRQCLAQDIARLAYATIRESTDPRIIKIVEKLSDGGLSHHEAALKGIGLLAEQDFHLGS
jgi:LAO/AO transport system kinase